MNQPAHEHLTLESLEIVVASELFNEIAKYFQRDDILRIVDSYEAGFDFIPAATAPIYSDVSPSRDKFEDLVHMTLAPDRVWHIEITNQEENIGLEIQSVRIPVKSPDGKKMVEFLRSDDVFLPLAPDGEVDQVIYEMSTDNNTPRGLSPEEMKRTLTDAGYGLPELFTEPEDLQQHMSDTFADSEQWDRREILFLTDPYDDSIWKLTRTSEDTPSDEEIEYGETYAAEHCTEEEDEDNILSIVFNVKEGVVTAPEIRFEREIPITDPSAIDSHDDDKVRVVDEHDITITIEALQVLKNSIQEADLDTDKD